MTNGSTDTSILQFTATSTRQTTNHAEAGLLLEALDSQETDKPVEKGLHCFVDMLVKDTGEIETRLILF